MNQQGRDDEREAALIEHLRAEARRLARYTQPCGVPGCPFMVRRSDGVWSHLYTHGSRTDHPAIGCLDAAADALARKHPEPEITEAPITEPKFVIVDERDATCVAAWPGCSSGEYDPRCCRFPKSCSAGSYRFVTVREGEQ